MRRRRICLAGIATTSTAALLMLHALGMRTSSPRSLGWAELDRWYQEAGAASSAIAGIRVLAMAGAAWVALAAALQLVASWRFGARCAWIADRLSPTLLRGVAHLAVTAGLAVPALPIDPVGDAPGTAVMVPMDVEAVDVTTSTTPTIPPAPPPSPSVPVEPAPTPEPPSPTADEVVVASGESFWSIAAEQAGDGDLVTYWRQLIELNRDRLVDPGNPDLLYPAQVLRLPIA